MTPLRPCRPVRLATCGSVDFFAGIGAPHEFLPDIAGNVARIDPAPGAVASLDIAQDARRELRADLRRFARRSMQVDGFILALPTASSSSVMSRRKSLAGISLARGESAAGTSNVKGVVFM